jgi:hypothetical protein
MLIGYLSQGRQHFSYWPEWNYFYVCTVKLHDILTLKDILVKCAPSKVLLNAVYDELSPFSVTGEKKGLNRIYSSVIGAVCVTGLPTRPCVIQVAAESADTPCVLIMLRKSALTTDHYCILVWSTQSSATPCWPCELAGALKFKVVTITALSAILCVCVEPICISIQLLQVLTLIKWATVFLILTLWLTETIYKTPITLKQVRCFILRLSLTISYNCWVIQNFKSVFWPGMS